MQNPTFPNIPMREMETIFLNLLTPSRSAGSSILPPPLTDGKTFCSSPADINFKDMPLKDILREIGIDFVEELK